MATEITTAPKISDKIGITHYFKDVGIGEVFTLPNYNGVFIKTDEVEVDNSKLNAVVICGKLTLYIHDTTQPGAFIYFHPNDIVIRADCTIYFETDTRTCQVEQIIGEYLN